MKNFFNSVNWGCVLYFSIGFLGVLSTQPFSPHILIGATLAGLTALKAKMSPGTNDK